MTGKDKEPKKTTSMFGKDEFSAWSKPEVCMAAIGVGPAMKPGSGRNHPADSRAQETAPGEQGTPEYFLAAVRETGLDLRCVPEALRTPEVCLAAVGSDGCALKYVPERLRTLKYVPERLRTSEVCLAAVGNDGWALESVPEALRTPEVCRMAAVNSGGNIGDVLEYVPKEILTPEFCLEVVLDAIKYKFFPSHT